MIKQLGHTVKLIEHLFKPDVFPMHVLINGPRGENELELIDGLELSFLIEGIECLEQIPHLKF